MTDSATHKNDRRWAKTETAIKEAFYELAAQGDFRKITITALANQANIDRKTFYLHYHSIEDLVHAIAKDEDRRMVGELANSMPERRGDRIDPTQLAANISRSLIDIGHEPNIEHARSAVAHVPIDEFLVYLEKPLVEEIIAIRGIENPAEAQHVRYGVTFFVAGLLAVCKKWLLEQPEEPLEDISNYLKAELAYGSSNLLEIKSPRP